MHQLPPSAELGPKPVLRFTCTHGLSGFSPIDSDQERLSRELALREGDPILWKRSVSSYVTNIFIRLGHIPAVLDGVVFIVKSALFLGALAAIAAAIVFIGRKRECKT
jgi:hypothetical protein